MFFGQVADSTRLQTEGETEQDLDEEDQQLEDRADTDDPAYIELDARLPAIFKRPSWRPNTFEGLLTTAWDRDGQKTKTREGDLCKLIRCPGEGCGKWIYVSTGGVAGQHQLHYERGKFVTGFDPKANVRLHGGYKNRGRPPIDHYSAGKPSSLNPTGDWVERLQIVLQEEINKWKRSPHGTASNKAEMRNHITDVYHRPGLRILHKKCNLSRPKQHFNVDQRDLDALCKARGWN